MKTRPTLGRIVMLLGAVMIFGMFFLLPAKDLGRTVLITLVDVAGIVFYSWGAKISGRPLRRWF